MSNEQPIPVVCALVFRSDGRLLIVQRPSSDEGPGSWEFPGGKVDPGEDDVQALKREILEELGMTITNPIHFHSVQHHYPNAWIELRGYLCQSEDAVQLREHQDLRWLFPHEIKEDELSAADRPILRKLQSRR